MQRQRLDLLMYGMRRLPQLTPELPARVAQLKEFAHARLQFRPLGAVQGRGTPAIAMVWP